MGAPGVAALGAGDGVEVLHGVAVAQIERGGVGAVKHGPVRELFRGEERSRRGRVCAGGQEARLFREKRGEIGAVAG